LAGLDLRAVSLWAGRNIRKNFVALGT